MVSDSVTDGLAEPAQALGAVSRRLRRSFRTQVEDWSDVCRNLTDWENRELIDTPTQERLVEHAGILDQLEKVGQWLNRSTQSADIHDPAIVQLLTATLQDLKDRRALWHGSLNSQQREEILRDLFHES